ncbi:MAG: amino acid adenylation domain-containing protein [Thermoanaerobaculia bacterium]|nr:amino acid adenylation domain-containing protein [Thermoanaerobaculia bacterium]
MTAGRYPDVQESSRGSGRTSVRPDHLAYVMYTSGSTGRPKGVAVSHGAVVRLVREANFLAITADDVFLQLAPTSFDAATLEIWGPLLNGACLAIPPAGQRSLAEIAGDLARFRVTTLWLTAGLFHQMAEHEAAALAGVRRVLAGGDVLAPALVERVVANLAPGAALVNGYGPTENTTFTTCHVMTSAADLARPVPIGRPISNTQVYVLDRDGEPVPEGVFGELHAGGLGVARGYLGRPGLTAERFLPDPWAPTPGARMYRTGDAARWRPDGTLEFAGRLDGQVKIRGFRVELGEIEAALASHPEVQAAAVAVVRQAAEVDLVAFLVISGEEGSHGEPPLRSHLASRLPAPLVPARFVFVAELPLDPNGKVDRRALAALDPGVGPRRETGDDTPRSALEATLAEHFAAVLGLPRVGIHERFFDLGGHSLKATQLVSRLRSELGLEVPLRLLFEGPTVAELARALGELSPDAGVTAPALLPRTSAEPPPASYSQERVWVLERFEPGTAAHNLPFAARLVGRPDWAGLAAALAGVVARHESLRTTFEAVDGQPVQIVAPPGPVPLPVVDLRHLPADRVATAAEAVLADAALTGFELDQGPLLRALVILEAPERARLQLVLHHTVFDGWSVPILLDELGELYRARLEDRAPRLPPLPVQYGDYALWQRRALSGAESERQLGYWRERLAGAPAGLGLPLDRPRLAVRSYRGGHTHLTLPAELSARLRGLASEADASLFMVLLAGFKALLARLSGESDVVVGAPIAGRGRAEVEGLIGMFLNTLVLRTEVGGATSFRELVSRVRETALGAFAHQDVPFERLLTELKPERDLSRTPFFQIFFNVLNLPESRPLDLPGVQLEPQSAPVLPSKFDLTLYVQPADAVHIHAAFNADLFDATTIDRLLAQYQTLLAAVAAAPEKPVDAADLVLAGDRDLLPDPTAPLDTTWVGPVFAPLARWATEAPERVALVDAEETFDYGDYARRVHRLAHRLIAMGVRRGDRVAILAQRTARLPLAVLATLEAGGVFVMLDPSYPAQRLVDMLEIAAPRALLVLAGGGLAVPVEVAEFLAAGRDFLGTLMIPDAAGERDGSLPDPGAGQPETPPEVTVGPDDLAYIAFTSGSTGKPKGVMGRHGPLSHFLPWLVERFGLTADDRFTMLSGLAHDPLQRDLFTPLWLGAALVAPDPRDLGVPGRLAGWLRRERLTVTHLTPAMAQILTERPSTGTFISAPTLRRAFLVGDVLTRRDVGRLRQLAPDITVVNLYGSTETQRAVGFHEIPPDAAGDREAGPGREVLPLGRGMQDVQLLILNAHGGPAGIGEVGELVVRSPHLAAGYLGDGALTAAKFVVNPATGEPGDRLYKTGDLGRYLPNGEAVFVGRADSQVKIRGFRIELGEIIGHLSKAPGVREVTVLLRRDGPLGERLAAYVVPEPAAVPAPTAATLREFLKVRLPNYMVPATFVFLTGRLPVTPNNKLDRRALLALDDRQPEGTMAKEAPTTEAEAKIAAIVQDVLKVPEVGLDDNFFELGGNSLLLVQVHGRLEQAFGHPILMVELFNHPTVRALANFLAVNGGSGGAGTEPAPAVVRTEQLQEGRDRLKRRLERRRG